MKYGILVCIFLLSACATSPEGRTQLVMMPAAQVDEMGSKAFEDIKKQTPISKDARKVTGVNCVAKLIVKQLEKVDEGAWEVQVFEKDDINAFALPGRKIGVFTGLLKVAKTPGQLAAVLGHEVGHVIANHGNERVSQAYIAQGGNAALQILFEKGIKDPTYRQIAGLLGAGAIYGGTLAYSRVQESEADMIGINLMARAGFDPRESVRLWENMGRAGGGQPPELLSTHPSNRTRIEQLESRMDSSMSVYTQSPFVKQAAQCSL